MYQLIVSLATGDFLSYLVDAVIFGWIAYAFWEYFYFRRTWRRRNPREAPSKDA